MGFIFDQIKQRQKSDQEMMLRSLGVLRASVIGGELPLLQSSEGDAAVREIFSWLDAEPQEPPSLMSDPIQRLDFMIGSSGILRRTVSLEGRWWKNAYGPMLAYTREGNAVALLPRSIGGYTLKNYETGEKLRLGEKSAELLSGEAICFFRPFPQRKMTRRDLWLFLKKAISPQDVAAVLAAAALAAVLGTMLPTAVHLIFRDVLPLHRASALWPVAVLLIGTSVSLTMTRFFRTLCEARLEQKVRLSVENAAMGRMLSLPAKFFMAYNAGELSQRLLALKEWSSQLMKSMLTLCVSLFLILAYLVEIHILAPSLAGITWAILATQLLVIALGIVQQSKQIRKKLQASGRLNGLTYRLFSSVEKLKLAGAEQRAFAKWAEAYGENVSCIYRPSFFLKVLPSLTGILSLAGSIGIYAISAREGLSPGTYLSFSSAYGLLSGSVMALSSVARQLSNLQPLLERAMPLLEAVPESQKSKKYIHRLSGSIELCNVSFRYAEDGPLILNHLNLKIRPGQYVGIVGTTGSGKSTLLRLLLGFETPTTGTVSFDNRDLQSVDLRSVRRNIGTVLQNGRLFSGSIYDNIVISNPALTMEDAWKAAELAGIAEDIRRMPMGMHTLVSEGGGGISGGQRQRILIARAIVQKPKILIFDEATSALDNLAQRMVTESLDSLKCTRIVVAHRLSTIRNCSRILVLDHGQIIEDGTYEKLIEKGGMFAKLVQRQMLE